MLLIQNHNYSKIASWYKNSIIDDIKGSSICKIFHHQELVSKF